MYEKLLLEHGVKPTANRVLIARALSCAAHPMSLPDLEREILTIDKSNIFRSLTLFKASHLVHVIDEGSGGVRYELCLSHDQYSDDDTHVHFLCDNCHKTFCMERTPVPTITLPDGFKMVSVNYVVKGLCPDCARKS